MPATDENLEFGIRLEADRLLNSFVKREDLSSEMTVVRNEFEMGENNPEAILLQRMMAAAYEWHNYGKSTIGNRADIERVPDRKPAGVLQPHIISPTTRCSSSAGKFAPRKTRSCREVFRRHPAKPEREAQYDYCEEAPRHKTASEGFGCPPAAP